MHVDKRNWPAGGCAMTADEVLDVLGEVGKVYDAAMASLAEVEIPGEREDVAREVRGG